MQKRYRKSNALSCAQSITQTDAAHSGGNPAVGRNAVRFGAHLRQMQLSVHPAMPARRQAARRTRNTHDPHARRFPASQARTARSGGSPTVGRNAVRFGAQ